MSAMLLSGPGHSKFSKPYAPTCVKRGGGDLQPPRLPLKAGSSCAAELSASLVAPGKATRDSQLVGMEEFALPHENQLNSRGRKRNKSFNGKIKCSDSPHTLLARSNSSGTIAQISSGAG